jgi:hypothetical protein
VKGVYLRRARTAGEKEKWRAVVYRGGKLFHLGTRDTELEALALRARWLLTAFEDARRPACTP